MSKKKQKDYKQLALQQLECLRAHAKNKGMTDQAIADITGISRPNVSGMLSGKNVPRLDTFMKLCEAVGLPLIDVCKID